MQRTVVDELVCHAYGDANLLPDGAETEKNRVDDFDISGSHVPHDRNLAEFYDS